MNHFLKEIHSSKKVTTLIIPDLLEQHALDILQQMCIIFLSKLTPYGLMGGVLHPPENNCNPLEYSKKIGLINRTDINKSKMPAILRTS